MKREHPFPEHLSSRLPFGLAKGLTICPMAEEGGTLKDVVFIEVAIEEKAGNWWGKSREIAQSKKVED